MQRPVLGVTGALVYVIVVHLRNRLHGMEFPCGIGVVVLHVGRRYDHDFTRTTWHLHQL